MNKKIATLIIVPVILAVLISSCSLFGVAAAIMGGYLKVDDNGHFKEDIIYQWGDGTDNNVYALYADGTLYSYRERYEDVGEDHDGDGVNAEGWVLIGGGSYKGTYSWDSDTMMLTEVATQTLTNGEWADVTNQTTMVTPTFFAENQYGLAFVMSDTVDNQWIHTMTTTIQNTSSSVSTQTFTVDADASTFVNNTVTTAFDDTGTQTNGAETDLSGTFTLLPADTKWKNGKVVTVLGTVNLTKTKGWDNTVADDWDATYTEDNDQSIVSYAFAHMGDFIILSPTFAVTRELY